MAGIDTYEDGVGYQHIKIQPHIGGGFTHASATLKTYYGTVSSGWKIANGKTILDVEIPANTTATVYMPAANAAAITENDKQLSTVTEIKVMGTENGYVLLKLGSGKYQFAADRKLKYFLIYKPC